MKRVELKNKICKNCNQSFNRGILPSGRLESTTDYRIRKFCCHKCFTDYNQGKQHSNYIRGYKTRSDGYQINGKGQYIHRVVMEEYLGRNLKSTEHIHHKDGNPSNNKIENLQLVSNSEHRKIESKIQRRDRHGRFTK
ncbi:MAG: HNH endonuclease signature motif containing protein [Flavobacteriales bacterium]